MVIRQPFCFEKQFPTINGKNSERFFTVTEIGLVIDFDGGNRRSNRSVEKFF